jgi:hypothetical protein
MSDPSNVAVVPITGPAPHETNISTEHPFNRMLTISVKVSKWGDSVEKLCGNHLQGCGRVDFVKMDIKLIPIKDGAWCKFGVCEVGSSYTTDDVSMKPNGEYFVSNQFSTGHSKLVKVLPEDTLSRQLRPISSSLPTMKFMLERSDDMVVTIILYLQVHGLVHTMLSLK